MNTAVKIKSRNHLVKKIICGNFYIISGWCDTTGRTPYQIIAKHAAARGYHVVKINPEWDESLIDQVFPITKDDVVFGFSMGAMLASMIGKKYEYKKMILASMTPVLDLSKQTMNILGKKISDDCKKFEYGGLPHDKTIYLYGDREIDKSLSKIMELTPVKIIPNTQHQLNAEYIRQILEEI